MLHQLNGWICWENNCNVVSRINRDVQEVVELGEAPQRHQLITSDVSHSQEVARLGLSLAGFGG